ncbi:uncharacterized protein LOC142802718 isoform X4 [Rhipicephalus microplus]|uniref:uncharacterized protein LOC142802718 isoform X4 n=1 Tax=Rhipicephalus microplus TaxID=6941 RepID=UPI003F6C9223
MRFGLDSRPPYASSRFEELLLDEEPTLRSTCNRTDVPHHNLQREKERAVQRIATVKTRNFKSSRTTVLCWKQFHDSNYHRCLSLMRVMGSPIKSAQLRAAVAPSIFVNEQNASEAPKAHLLKRPKDQLLHPCVVPCSRGTCGTVQWTKAQPASFHSCLATRHSPLWILGCLLFGGTTILHTSKPNHSSEIDQAPCPVSPWNGLLHWHLYEADFIPASSAPT